MEQRSVSQTADTRKGIRWLHAELHRLLSDLSYENASASDSPGGGDGRGRGRGMGEGGGRAAMWQKVVGMCGAQRVLAESVLYQITAKGHVSQHLRFSVTQQTYKECLRSHTSPQLLRAWVKLAQAVFTLPLPSQHCCILLRHTTRLQICRHLAMGRFFRGWGGVGGEEESRRQAGVGVGGLIGGGGGNVLVQEMFGMWCVAHEEGGRSKRFNEAVLCATKAWASKVKIL
jgi:hypothetical protein